MLFLRKEKGFYASMISNISGLYVNITTVLYLSTGRGDKILEEID